MRFWTMQQKHDVKCVVVHECQARESRVVSLVNEVRILGYLLSRLLVFALPILLLALVVCYDEPVAAALILL